jgi:hypothetical protein
MFSGVERLFLLNAVSLSETHESLAALKEAKKADVRDIAKAAAIALTERAHEGKTYALVGPRAINGHGARTSERGSTTPSRFRRVATDVGVRGITYSAPRGGERRSVYKSENLSCIRVIHYQPLDRLVTHRTLFTRRRNIL